MSGDGSAMKSEQTATPSSLEDAGASGSMQDDGKPEGSSGIGVQADINVGIDANTGVGTQVKTFTVEGSNFKYMPTQMTVRKGDTVRIVFKNTEGFHDFVIDEFKAKTKQFKEGNEETIEFIADKAGSFEYYCSVGKHREMGMKGTLTVTE